MNRPYADAPFNTTLPAPGAGREYTFGQLVKIAMRQLWRNKGRVLMIAMVTALLTAAIEAAADIAVNTLVRQTMNLASADWQRAVCDVLMALLRVLGNAVPTAIVLEGYKWATIRSFDRPRMAWGDLLSPVRRPWRGSVLRLALLIASMMAALQLASTLWFKGVVMRSWAGPGVSLGWQQVMMMLFALIVAIAVICGLELLTLLVGPAILASSRPTLHAGLRENWRILCGQPRRMLAVAGIHIGLALLVQVAVALSLLLVQQLIGPQAYGSFLRLIASWGLESFAVQAIHLIPLAVSLHLVAVLFRSAYGLPLEPQTPEFMPTMPMPDVRPAQPPIGDEPQREATP